MLYLIAVINRMVSARQSDDPHGAVQSPWASPVSGQRAAIGSSEWPYGRKLVPPSPVWIGPPISATRVALMIIIDGPSSLRGPSPQERVMVGGPP